MIQQNVLEKFKELFGTDGEVEFKISDKALVGVLKQHNNRTNRLR